MVASQATPFARVLDWLQNRDTEDGWLKKGNGQQNNTFTKINTCWTYRAVIWDEIGFEFC